MTLFAHIPRPKLSALIVASLLLSGAHCASESSDADYLVEQADAYRGGILWDRWWQVDGVLEPLEPGSTGDAEDRPPLPSEVSSILVDSPLYVQNPVANQRRGPDTWRCAECHGWDYRGKHGEYAAGTHQTGFGGVWGARSASAEQLFDAVGHGGQIEHGATGHAFAKVLSERDIADLVKFLREGLVPRSDFVQAQGTARGDVERGLTRFSESCVSCHGEDGKKLNLAEDQTQARYLSDVALDEPGRFIHKARFGQPNNSMPSADAQRLLLGDLADLLAYVQALAQVQARESSDSEAYE
ncbi:MAG: c-type cytochrome [Nannocystaceae bacterium]